MDLSGLIPTIEQAPGFAEQRERLARAGARETAGLTDAAKPATLAAIASHESGPVVIVTGRSGRALSLCEEISAWAGEGRRVLHFPERDVLPYERLASDPAAARDRLGVLAALDLGERVIVVASALGVAQRTLGVDDVRGAVQTVRNGEKLDMEDFLREIDRLGYNSEALVQQAGEFSRRGGIIDVFPPTLDEPIRIEFFGDDVDSIRQFAPFTQRTTQTLEEITIGPAQEVAVASRAPALAMLEKLNYLKTTAEVRAMFEDDVAWLQSDLAFPNRNFYVPFLAPATLLDHLPEGSLLVIDEEADLQAAVEEAEKDAETSRKELEEQGEIPRGLPRPFEDWPSLSERIEKAPRVLRLARWATDGDVARIPFTAATAYGGQVKKLVDDAIKAAAKGQRTVVVSQQAERIAELFAEQGQPVVVAAHLADDPPLVSVIRGSLSEGWKLSEPSLTLLADSEIFGFVKQRRAAPRAPVNREAFLAELVVGSYVVHIDHGIAKFAGLVQRTVDGNEREYLELHYAEGDRLFVPTDQLDRVSRYIGPSERMPHPTRLSSGEWARAKQRVRKAVQQLARDLLALYAQREAMPGYAFPADTAWQAELEGSFPYVETPDQLAAIHAVKNDMETARPMDRLVCGDVGYGKTEVAIRAAFKAVMDGKQVAILVPTTVLAQQHYNTFRERLGAFPARVDVISRFRSDPEQKAIVEKLASGEIDIIIGTHRILQKDIKLKDLGLVIIDEEQRFGVGHKEFLKQMRQSVDVLTLSATPIPRTLYMSLGGIRDMSTMDTPPEERLPIKTYVAENEDRTIREAVTRELERGGQVYFVHNRVNNIDLIANKVRDIVPDARVGIGHGQMDEHMLARVMDEFTRGELDVLVCTTIIESGLDIPNVNTIIINHSDKLGLAQLYQLRGRVGRGANRAYAYLLHEKKGRLSDTARQRLQTIFEATELGAGFQIALRDLEIRGAGNLLGAEQSGYMSAIGFDLYVKLLANAVERYRSLMRGETPEVETEGPDITIDLPMSAHLPATYVPDLNMRLALYQRLSAAPSPETVEAIEKEMVDRLGEPPPVAQNLLYVVTLRAMARPLGIESIRTENGSAVIRTRESQPLPVEALEATVPRGVQVTRHVMRVELSEGWRDRLRKTLEEIIAAKAAEEATEAVSAGER
ncbi:MAG: transcription-repair coupling factor [Chloroflexota bacterium]